MTAGQRSLRSLHSASPRLESSNKPGSEVGQANQPPKANPEAERRIPTGPRAIPTALDRIFLVWSGHYKSKDQIPRVVDGEVIHRVRSWGRIRINIGFLFLAAAGGGVMVYLGKRDAARGDSIEKQNMEWHREQNQEYQRNKK